MPISIPGRVVLFDYGEVVSHPQSEAAHTDLLRAAGEVDADAFWAAYWGGRHELDRGTLSIEDYWLGIGRACGVEWTAGRVSALWMADLRSWLSANADVVDVIADLRAGGTRLALLSNAAADYGSVFRFAPWADGFAGVFVSGELRLLKPEAAIYEHVASALEVPLASIVFIDNRADNVAGAEALGITGHVFTDAGALRVFLESLAG